MLRFFASSLVLILACVGSLLCGVTNYSPTDLIRDSEARAIVLNLRLPRVLCAVLVGSGLAVVGASYQSIFRNYLASPFTLGVSSGAALCASLALVTGLSSSRYGLDVGLWALVGALLSIALIVLVHRRARIRDSNSLLLVGVVFSFFCSSVMTLIQYVADYAKLFQVTRWLMGGIPTAGWSDILIGFACVGVTTVWLIRNARGLDLLLFGDDLAAVKGVDVARLVNTTFVFSSFVVGWVVAQCGVIGFVGIVVPAVSRLFVGAVHRAVLPMSFVCGALLVVVCDLLGRVVIAPFEVPAGVFTAVLGGPIFTLLVLYPPRVRGV